MKNTFNVNDVVFFTDRENENPGDEAGFVVLISEPDKSNSVPVRRVSDGEYFCLPVAHISKRVVIKGRFWSNGFLVRFAVADPVYADSVGWSVGAGGNLHNYETMAGFKHFVSDELEITQNIKES